MQIILDAEGGPAYKQIIAQVKDARARGELRPGERVPTVRELAAQLGLNRNTVALGYSVLRQEGVLVGRTGGGTWVAEPAAAAELPAWLLAAIETAARDSLAAGLPPLVLEHAVEQAVERWRPATRRREPADTRGLVRCMGSHDFCLDLLARRLHATAPDFRLASAPIGSTAGILAVGSGDAQLAGVHLLDPVTGDYNRAAVSALLPGADIRLVTLVYREQGLLVRRGNPLGLRNAADLAAPGVRFASRQPGSGTRALLDYLLARAGLTYAQLNPTHEVATHLAVAAAVAGGTADAGLGVRAAAHALDLDFVPLAFERYDLAFRRADESAPWFAALLETLASPELRADIEALAGYDASQTAWILTLS